VSALDFTARALAMRAIDLAGDNNGYVTPEQFGCPAYAPGVDQLPWLQHAIDHVEATPGLNGVLLTQGEYELWRTEWTGTAADYGTTSNTSAGNFLVVSKPIRIVSTHPLASTLHFKGPNGGSLLTDYTVVDGTAYGDDMLHRGAGFLLWSEAWVSGEQAPLEDLPALYLENIRCSTGMVGTRNTNWPSSVADPNSFDITNKFITARNDRQHGRVELRNCEVDGFFGENLYLGGVLDDDHLSSELILRNVRIKNSNGTAMNPNGCAVVDIEGLYVENCSATWEGFAGWKYARLANCRFRDCGGAGAVGSNDYAAARRGDNSQPFLTLDNVTAQNCVSFNVGSYVKGNVRLIDTQLKCIGFSATQKLVDIDLDVTIECDTMNLAGLIHLYANAAAPAQSVKNVQIRALLTRSDYAIANNFYHNGIVVLGASYGPNCVIRVRGDHLGLMPSMLGSAPVFTDYRPKIVDDGLWGTDNNFYQSAALEFDPATTPSPEFGYRWLEAVFSGAGVTAQYPVSAPPLTNFLDGHEVTFEHNDVINPAATVLIDNRIVLGHRDRVTLRADRRNNRWVVTEGENAIIGPIEVGDEVSAITAGTGKKTFFMPRRAFTLRQIDAELITAQAANGNGGVFTVDVNKDGASLLATKLTIDNTETTSRTAPARQAISDSAIAAGARITVDVDQVGDGTAAGLRLWLIGKWS